MMYTIASGCMAVRRSLEEMFLLARELGFDRVDLLLVSGWAHIGLDELAQEYSGVCRRVERALRRADLQLGAVNARYSTPLEQTGEAQMQRERETNALMDFMDAFGVDRVSIQPTLTPDREVLRAGYPNTVREVMHLAARYAQRKKKLSLEPHTMSAFCTNLALHALREEHPSFPITFDPSHLLCEGEEMEDVLWLIPGTPMVHLRDAAPGRLFVPFGQGGLDVHACIKSLALHGYDGPIAIEYIHDDGPNAEEQENLALFRQSLEREISAVNR